MIQANPPVPIRCVAWQTHEWVPKARKIDTKSHTRPMRCKAPLKACITSCVTRCGKTGLLWILLRRFGSVLVICGNRCWRSFSPSAAIPRCCNSRRGCRRMEFSSKVARNTGIDIIGKYPKLAFPNDAVEMKTSWMVLDGTTHDPKLFYVVRRWLDLPWRCGDSCGRRKYRKSNAS